jgi:hypothetical protein
MFCGICTALGLQDSKTAFGTAIGLSGVNWALLKLRFARTCFGQGIREFPTKNIQLSLVGGYVVRPDQVTGGTPT